MLKNSNIYSSFSVNDLKKAQHFYGKKLGLKIEEIGEGLVLYITNDSKVFIYPKPDHIPAVFTILNFSVIDIDVAIEELKKQDINMEHYDLPDFKTDDKGVLREGGGTKQGRGPKAIAWFKDTAGNIISVMQEK